MQEETDILTVQRFSILQGGYRGRRQQYKLEELTIFSYPKIMLTRQIYRENYLNPHCELYLLHNSYPFNAMTKDSNMDLQFTPK